MNDLYLKLANSQLTQPLFQALNLPQPIELKRSPSDCLAEPRGSILIAATQHNFALSSIFKALDTDNTTLFSARSNGEAFSLSAAPSSHKATSKEIQLDNIGSQQFKALVFDATGIKSSAELKQLYSVFKRSVRQIRNNGRFVIIAQTTEQCDNSEISALQGSLIEGHRNP